MSSSQEPNSFVAGVGLLPSFTAYRNPTVYLPLNVTKRNSTAQPRNYRRTCRDWDPRLAIRGGGVVGASCPLLQAECLFDVQYHFVPLEVEKEPHNTKSVFLAGSPRIADRATNREPPTARGHNFPRPETQRDACPETPRTRVFIYEPSIHDSLMSSQASIPSVTLPPKLRPHGPRHLEMTMSDSVTSIRGPIIPSAVSNDCPSTLATLGVVNSHLSPRNSPATSARKRTHSGRTLDRGSNRSEDISVITLPSFVEHERRTSTPSPILTLPGLLMVEGVGSHPSSRQSSPLYHLPRSPGRVANITTPTTPCSATYPRRNFPSPSLLVPDWQPHPLYRTRSPTRRAGARRESSIAKLKSEVRSEAVWMVQPVTPETSRQPGTNRPRLDALSPLRISTRAYPLLGSHDSLSMGNQPPSYEERDTGVVSHGPPWSFPPRPSPSETLRAEPGDTSPALPTSDAAEPSPSYLSPVPDSNSPSSCSSPDERRIRAVSPNRSSTSTFPSVSAFPSPPGFAPGSRDGTTLVVSNYPTYLRAFSTATLWENNPVGSVETASPNEGHTLTSLPDAEAPLPMPTVNSRSVLNGHLHPELVGGDGTSVWPGVHSRISSMRRLSRTPSGPRQMSHGQTAPRSRTHPPSA